MDETTVMTEANLDEDEFNDLYTVLLKEIKNYGTHGVQTMLNYLEQELNEGREFIE